MTRKYRDINRRFLDAILPKLLHRCEERILNTTWEVNIFDEQMNSQLKSLQKFIAGEEKSVQQSQSVNRFFTAKEQLIKFLSNAKTVLMIVDTQIGQTTFDCIQKVRTPIRLLTQQTLQDLAASAGRNLTDGSQLLLVDDLFLGLPELAICFLEFLILLFLLLMEHGIFNGNPCVGGKGIQQAAILIIKITISPV